MGILVCFKSDFGFFKAWQLREMGLECNYIPFGVYKNAREEET
jgi:hypothetical protein